MNYTKIIDEIRTIRDFKNNPVEQSIIEEIITTGKDAKGVGNDENVSVLFIDNGNELIDKLSGKAGYYGKLIEAPHYLVITSEEFPGYMENSGYIMELMRLKAWDKGLGTCWLSIEDEDALKEVLGIGSNSRLTAFAAIGYQYKGIFKKDLSSRADRHGVEEIVYFQNWGNPCPVDILENRGFANVLHYTKLAPSWGNEQPWRFIIDNDKVVLTIKENHKREVHLDAGIIMLYFEKSAHEEGIRGSWTVDGDNVILEKYGIPQEYEVIGFFDI